MTDDIGTDPTEPIEPAVPADGAVERTAVIPAAEDTEPTVLATPAPAARKTPWQMWAAVAVSVLLVVAIGGRVAFGLARSVAFHGHRAGFAAASVQRFDRRHEGRQTFRSGRGFRRGGLGSTPRGRG